MSTVRSSVRDYPTTLVDVVRLRCATTPRSTAFTFLHENDAAEQESSYEELDRQARRIAAWLQQENMGGQRILLVYPQSIEYIAAFLGCLYAGTIAVPAYPPRVNRNLQRIKTVVRDCEPAIALTTRGLLTRIQTTAKQDPELASLPWIATDEIDISAADSWSAPRIDEQSIAFLQYTSGSTAEPKGVIVSHGNLIANEKMIQQAFDVTDESVIVGWLPLYHDMGLIGNVLQALWAGAHCVLLSPAMFLRRPLDWLYTISRYRGTISGGPNFAYELCARKASAPECTGLDLSSWRVAFNGSEPIRSQTMGEFSAKFACYGFDPCSFFPCYGLAEATLFVSGRAKHGIETLRVSSESLANRELVASQHESHSQLLVSSGSPGAGQEIAIVDPDTLNLCAPGRIGEVWVAGENIAGGYWNKADTSREVFRAFTKGSTGPYLRTGDLGYFSEGELFITGRIKDLIIVRGRNYYPQDLEFAVSRSHPSFSGCTGAAFTIEAHGSAQLVFVQEVAAGTEVSDPKALIQTIVQTIAEEQELRVHVVGLVRFASLPKTSSGKIRRHECRRQFLNSELKLLALVPPEPCTKSASGEATKNTPLREVCYQNLGKVQNTLKTIAAEILRLHVDAIEMDTPLTAYGLDSLQAAELSERVAATWSIDLPLAGFLAGSSISSIAALVACNLESNDQPQLRRLQQEHDLNEKEWPLSCGQRALLYLYNLAPEAASYHIPVAVRIHGMLDIAALRLAINALVRRHESLRSIITTGINGPTQRVTDMEPLPLQVATTDGWSEKQIRQRLMDEAIRPFNLREGPLYRVLLLQQSSEEHVLMLVFHHIVTDFISLTLLFEELRELYEAYRCGLEPEVPFKPYHYADFVRWQHDTLRDTRGEQLRLYWEQQLGGGLPILKLPTDHPRPPVQSYRGATFNFWIDPPTTVELRRLADTQKTTLYTVLLAAFAVLLYRYTAQNDIVIGTPVSGRTLPAWSQLAGYLVNQIVIRSQVSGRETFQEFLSQIRHLVKNGLAHQDYPLAAVAENIQPERDPAYPPLFQVMFSFQKAGSAFDENLVALALGEPGYQIAFDGLRIESAGFTHDSTELDLTLLMAQLDNKLVASFRYNSDLFDDTTVARMANHFRVLLHSIISQGDSSLCELRLLPAAEETQVLVDWNSTDRKYPLYSLIHELISAQAFKSGDSLAVIAEGEQLTYLELEWRSNQLAHYLRSKGCGAGTIVGLCMERGALLLVGMLGILKSGAAYLPLDPEWPSQRIDHMLKEAQVYTVVTQRMFAADLKQYETHPICLDRFEEFESESILAPERLGSAEDLAYVMYTSGSTGKPKGVMVPHSSVINFFHAMDERITCGPKDTLLAVTAVSFDISVLELLWTLARGAKVVLANPRVAAPVQLQSSAPKIDYSLFYFASSDEQKKARNKYGLLIEGAKYADKNGFKAVWTPERHFHSFGGLYPNPAVTSAALATITKRIQIRAGSVVLPLHNVIRVAEEWSIVDNLSDGRIGLAFASGWHADDFVLAPHNYPNRKEVMFEAISTLQRLWSGESVSVQSGSGKEIEVRIFPRPRQERLPIWITAAGTQETFIRAGQMGAHVLTHLLGQTVEDVAEKVRLYREALHSHGHDPDSHKVSLMLHAFLGDDKDSVKEMVRAPFTRYLASSVDLIKNFARSADLPINFETMTQKDMDDLLAFAFDRYFETSALFGTVTSCAEMIERLATAGVNEVACLVDFGVADRAALNSLTHIAALNHSLTGHSPKPSRSIAELAAIHQPTLMQCTPAIFQMIIAGTGSLAPLQSLRTLMLGGESLPPALAREIKETLPCRLVNMYGPTETTIWSSTAGVTSSDLIHIGTPIANTTMYIRACDSGLPTPIGVVGELYVGGHGVTRGYLAQPALTAERFVPDPFTPLSGQRLYRTGDLARYLPDGNIQLIGRDDYQTKIRGVRIELGEIESALCEHAAVDRAVVITKTLGKSEDKQLVAYILATPKYSPTPATLRAFLKSILPEAMIPSRYIFLDKLPLTTSGKVARDLLPEPHSEPPTKTSPIAQARGHEVTISSIWKRVLETDAFGLDDNFFDMGGHSLRLVQVHGELSRLLERDVPLVKLLEYPTIRSLASYLDSSSLDNNIQSRMDRSASQRAAILQQQKSRRAAAITSA